MYETARPAVQVTAAGTKMKSAIITKLGPLAGSSDESSIKKTILQMPQVTAAIQQQR
jgi:hypothetical protein